MVVVASDILPDRDSPQTAAETAGGVPGKIRVLGVTLGGGLVPRELLKECAEKPPAVPRQFPRHQFSPTVRHAYDRTKVPPYNGSDPRPPLEG